LLTHCCSILDTASQVSPQASLQRLPRQVHASSLQAITNSAAKAKPLGQDVNKDTRVRKKEIDEADVAPYPQYARSGDPIPFPSFAETFEYLKPGELQEIDKSTGNGSLVVEGAII
jgi:hypothetical protein